MTSRGERTVTFRCAGRKLVDGSVEAEIPAPLFKAESKHRSMEHRLEIVEALSPLMGTLTGPCMPRRSPSRATTSRLAHGSSNFTVKGLGLDAQPNCEINVAYVMLMDRVKDAPPDQHLLGRHPKIQPVVDRVASLWVQGEKFVVFCHYRKTGQALVHHISAALENVL